MLKDAAGRRAPAPAILNNLGIIQLRRGGTAETGKPVYFLTKAAEAAPDDPDILFNLGYAYALDRDPQGAIYWLREALRRNPTDGDAHAVLASALDASGSAVEAGARARAGRAAVGRRYADRQPRGRAAAARTRARPRRTSSRVRGQRHRSGDHRHGAARSAGAGAVPPRARPAAVRGEQDREATDELRRAVFLSPYEAEAHLLLGRIHLRGGRPAGRGRRAQDLDLEPRYRGGAGRAGRRLSSAEGSARRPRRTPRRRWRSIRSRPKPSLLKRIEEQCDRGGRAEGYVMRRAWLLIATGLIAAHRGGGRGGSRAGRRTPRPSTASSIPSAPSSCVGDRQGRRRRRRADRLHAAHAGRPARLDPRHHQRDARGEDAGRGLRRALGPPRGLGRASSSPSRPTSRRWRRARTSAPRIPVSGDGEKIDEVMAKKMASDTAAYARTLATQRGRNVAARRAGGHREPLLHRAGGRSRATPPLIDVIASDVPDLIRQLDGRTVKRFNGSTVDAEAGERRQSSTPR